MTEFSKWVHRYQTYGFIMLKMERLLFYTCNLLKSSVYIVEHSYSMSLVSGGETQPKEKGKD